MDSCNNNLRKIRISKNLTQEMVCDGLKKHGCYVCRTTYSKYETGYRQIPSDVIICLSRYFEVSADCILGMVDID